jgi:hypothetical protein
MSLAPTKFIDSRPIFWYILAMEKKIIKTMSSCFWRDSQVLLTNNKRGVGVESLVDVGGRQI